MEGLEARAVELLDKLEKITVTLTPQALDVAEGCMRVSGINRVLFGLTIVAIFSYMIYRLLKFLKTEECNTEFVTFAIFISSGLILGGICKLLYVWNWIAIFNPKLAIANKLLGF